MGPGLMGPRPTGPCPTDERGPRRVAVLFLPDLLVELVLRRSLGGSSGRGRKFVVVEAVSGRELGARAKVLAVSPRARHLGVQRGLTVAEATGICADLEVLGLEASEVTRARIEVAESVRSFGSPVALELVGSRSENSKEIGRDCVWLDVTGSAMLFGGERALAEELGERVRQLGHAVRVVISGGPKIGRALARDAALEDGVLVVAPGNEREALSVLSIFSLGLTESEESWLNRLGVWSVSALTALPPEMLVPRLGPSGVALWELATGSERTPLSPLEWPTTLVESCSWDEPLPSLEPLLFSLRGLVGRLAARLEGRGEAASSLLLGLGLEVRGASARSHEVGVVLPAPLHRAADLERVLRSRLEKISLETRVTSLSVSASGLLPAQRIQLNLESGERGNELELPILLEELSAEVGKERFGLLEVEESHRPEKRSRLRGWFEKVSRRSRTPRLRETNRVTRLFPNPLRLPVALTAGESLLLGGRSFRVVRVDFAERLEGVEWWTESSTARDYYWLWLEEGRLEGRNRGLVEALVYRDPRDERWYLQGLCD